MNDYQIFEKEYISHLSDSKRSTQFFNIMCCFILTNDLFSTFAVPCPVGEFSRSGLMPCYPCPQDYYQPESGKSFCLSCPFYGTTTFTGATSITDCSSKMIHFLSYLVTLCINQLWLLSFSENLDLDLSRSPSSLRTVITSKLLFRSLI